MSGDGVSTPIFRLRELCFEYWTVPLVDTVEVFDDVETGDDLISAISSSALVKGIAVNGELSLNLTPLVTSKPRAELPKIRNVKWTSYYDTKIVNVDYKTRDETNFYFRSPTLEDSNHIQLSADPYFRFP